MELSAYCFLLLVCGSRFEEWPGEIDGIVHS